VVAALTRRFGDLDIAEEAAAEAFAAAVERWPADGVPPNPGAWLTTTANRKAIDRIRRENKRDDKHREAQMVYDDDPPEPAGAIDDERLRLIFTCCHPALAMQTRVALTLRMVGGLTVPEIARAFLVQETAVGSGSPARRPRSRRLASLTGCRPRRISRHASPACSPSCSSSSTRATWRPAPTPIPYVTT
jgi:predicted RNA polymerase sigma factor